MAEFTFPSRDIEKPDLLLSFLGSHWSAAWSNRQQIRSLMQARGDEERQKQINLGEAAASVSRLTVPVFHTDHWFKLTLKESELNDENIAVLRYGEGAVYGHDPITGVEYKYGVPQNLWSMFPILSTIAESTFIFNRLTQPSVSLSHGLDYFFDITDNAIVFRENPFRNPLISIQEVYSAGIVVDREITLWMFRPKIDLEDIYKQFGYVLDLKLDSSEEYRGYLNAIWDGVVEGASGKDLEEAIASLTDTPVVQTDGEIVQHIQKDHLHLLVLTDKQAYRYPTNTLAVVSVGDTVNAGDQLVDTVRIFEFHDGVVPIVTELAAVEVGQGFIVSGFVGGITFYNKSTPLDVDTSGIFTRIEFSVGGFVGDIAEFWDQFHARGVDNPPTLAQLLDQRTNKVGEPTAAALPVSINPLEFLIQNVLRNNAFVVKIRVNQQGPNRIPLSHAKQLRRIIPPHTAIILLVELVVDNEVIIMEQPGDDLLPGFEEAPALGAAFEPITETLDPATLISEDDEPRLRQVEGICL